MISVFGEKNISDVLLQVYFLSKATSKWRKLVNILGTLQVKNDIALMDGKAKDKGQKVKKNMLWANEGYEDMFILAWSLFGSFF